MQWDFPNNGSAFSAPQQAPPPPQQQQQQQYAPQNSYSSLPPPAYSTAPPVQQQQQMIAPYPPVGPNYVTYSGPPQMIYQQQPTVMYAAPQPQTIIVQQRPASAISYVNGTDLAIAAGAGESRKS